MRRHIVIAIPLVILLAISACTVTGTESKPIVSTVVSTSKPPEKSTGTPVNQPVSTNSTVNALTSSCGLLNSRDLASFFPSHTEAILPMPKTSQVSHPSFSMNEAVGTETLCVYYAFHLPGSSTEVVLQVNTWVDVPSQATSSEGWTQDWAQARLQAVQTIPDLGDGAFFRDGRLTFKKNDLYVTIEASETDLDLKTSAGENRQRAIEKQIALDILGRLG